MPTLLTDIFFRILTRNTDLDKKAYLTVKRAFDVAGSVALIALTAPVSLAAALMIKAESPGPVIFVHDRTGQNGSNIRIYKFRSMRKGSEKAESVLNDEELEKFYQEYKLQDDPRITETGRFLRITSLDELPQLVNVIQGRMSLVGPRPVTAGELLFYSEEDRKKVLKVKPGLTGLWQVSDRSRMTYQSGLRQKTELYYAENASLMLDIKIILKTPAAVVKRIRGQG